MLFLSTSETIGCLNLSDMKLDDDRSLPDEVLHNYFSEQDWMYLKTKQ